MNNAAKQGFNAAVVFGKFNRGIHIFTNARKTFEIAVDKALCFAARNTQIARQTKTGNSIDDAKVDRFGLPANIRRHLIQRHIKHFRCRHGMNILTFAKGGLEAIDTGHMGQYAQLNLAIIKTDQNLSRLGNKGFADTPAIFGSNGDIL